MKLNIKYMVIKINDLVLFRYPTAFDRYGFVIRIMTTVDGVSDYKKGELTYLIKPLDFDLNNIEVFEKDIRCIYREV